MKITREVNGIPMEFVLTDDELYDAYVEQQETFDRLDVKSFTVDYYLPEDFKDVFGVTVEEFAPMLDDVVGAYRDRPIDACEEVQEAARKVIREHKEAKGEWE